MYTDIEKNISAGLKKNDEKAFKLIYTTYYASLCVFAERITHDSDEAEDIVQETIYNLWDKRNSIKINSSFKSYLFGAVRNRSINYLKKKKNEDNYLNHVSIWLQNIYSDQFEKLICAELEKKIMEIIDTFPDKTKDIFKQNRFNGLKYDEIANKEGLTTKGVEFHMTKAIKILRKELHEYIPVLIYFFAGIYKG